MDTFLLFATVKCFSDLGCFPVDAPFRCSQRPISVSPFSPHIINSSFLLYTRHDPTTPQVFTVEQISNLTYFGAWRQSKMIIHGYQEDGFTKEWIKELVSALLVKNDFNVFVVDWARGAHTLYPQAVANARVVGALIAQLILQLTVDKNVSAESFHLIGHSLGAHIAGYVGERVEKLGRITGLDPAQPYFEGTDTLVRLDPSDAKFVDVIHTDAKSFWRGGMGMRSPCGHTDFYSDGGKNQPGCNAPLMKTIFKNDQKEFLFGVRQWMTCSHKRAHQLFTQSITSDFISIRCPSYSAYRRGECFNCGSLGRDCARMGFPAEHDFIPRAEKISKYFLLTAASSPYKQYQNRLSVHITNSSGHAGKFYVRISLKQNPLKIIRLKLVTKSNIRGWISNVFPSHKFLHVHNINIEFRPNSASIVNPLTYFNADIPEVCVDSIVIDTLDIDREIKSCKFKTDSPCTQFQTFNAKKCRINNNTFRQ